MSVTTFERQTFGEPLAPSERLVAGIVAAIAAAGHVLLGLAAAWFVYVLVLAL